MTVKLHSNILRNATKFLRLMEGHSYQSQWRGVELARTLCKQIGVDISEALGSGLYPNIGAAHEIINKAISDLKQEGTK